MKKNNNEEFIKINSNDFYIDKNNISTLISKAIKFFDSFENFAKTVNAKLDFLIECQLKKDNGTNNIPAFLSNLKEKQPEDNKSQHNSKKSENVSANGSGEPYYEENKRKRINSKIPADSIRNRNEKKKNNMEK